MPTLLTKLFQSQYIVSLNENNSLNEEKVYERNSRFKNYESLDQVKNILTAVKEGVLSGVQLINDENFYVCINGKKRGKLAFFFIKLYFMIRKDIVNGTTGVSQLRFITWIQIHLYLVTKKS